MKRSTINLSGSLVSALKKLFFCSQVIIISLSLPSLFYVGITHNNSDAKHIVLNNKGKKFLAIDKKKGNDKPVNYTAFFIQV